MELKHIRVISGGTTFNRSPEGCRECPTSCQSACKTSCTVGSQVCKRQEKKK